jgi:AcrR family transcriptional regulator
MLTCTFQFGRTGPVRDRIDMIKPPRKKERIRNPVQTRTRLLQATVDLIAEKGSEALSLKEATIKANLSRGVAYQHFKDRDHLLREAKSWISNRLADGIEQRVAASLEESIAYSAKVVLDNREAAKLWIADAIAGEEFTTRHPLYRLVSKMLRDFKASGDARDNIDLEVLTYIMLGTNAVMLMLRHTRSGHDSHALARRFAREWARILCQGIFKDARRAALISAGAVRTPKRPRSETR